MKYLREIVPINEGRITQSLRAAAIALPLSTGVAHANHDTSVPLLRIHKSPDNPSPAKKILNKMKRKNNKSHNPMDGGGGD